MAAPEESASRGLNGLQHRELETSGEPFLVEVIKARNKGVLSVKTLNGSHTLKAFQNVVGISELFLVASHHWMQL